MTFEQIAAEIQSRHFAEVPIGIDRQAIDHAAEMFLRFLELPVEIKQRLEYVDDPDGQRNLHGYASRKQQFGHSDNKEFFQYTQLGHEIFSKQPEGQHADVQTFLTAAHPVYEAAIATSRQIIHALGGETLMNQFFPANRHPDCMLRFLKYDSVGPGDFLAKGHYDRGVCTLAIAESAPGLRIGSCSEDLKPIEHTPGTAIFFPGFALEQYTSPLFKPAWHDVVQRSEHVVSPTVARWAIVLFIDIPGMKPVTYSDAHTPSRGDGIRS